jgi:hypothetical protein
MGSPHIDKRVSQPGRTEYTGYKLAAQYDSSKYAGAKEVLAGERNPQRLATVNSYASPTPAIEDGRVYVHYGTYGTACLDTHTGEILWTRRDLNCDHHMGPGASPILHGDHLIFTVDGCDVQYVVALDKQTGETAWKTDRCGHRPPFPAKRCSCGRGRICIGFSRCSIYGPTTWNSIDTGSAGATGDLVRRPIWWAVTLHSRGKRAAAGISEIFSVLPSTTTGPYSTS